MVSMNPLRQSLDALLNILDAEQHSQRSSDKQIHVEKARIDK